MADRFTESEARRIFAEAARASHAGGAPDDGLTLDELQEIGRAAGIDPAAVATAAAAVRHGAGGPAWHGVPLATRRTRVVAGTLDDDAWAEAVALLRREFKFQGVAEQIGRRRTWTHAVGESVQAVAVQVTVEPVQGGTRLTVESGDGSERTAARVLGLGFALLAVGFGALGLAQGNASGALLGAVLAVFGVALYALIRSSAVQRARREPVRYDAVLDRLERLVRPAAAPGPATERTPAASESGAPGPPGAGPVWDAPAEDDAPTPAPRRSRA